ncbi:unnamed protein product, partial [Symbiodinium sp. CCMP2456]
VAKAANRGQKSSEVKTPPARATAALANNPTTAKAHPPPANTPATAPPASTTPAPKAVPKDPPVANPTTPASSKAPPPQIVLDDPVPADPAPPQPTPEPATQPGAPERAPALASEAPPFRVGHTINDSEGRSANCVEMAFARRHFQIAPLPSTSGIGAETASERNGARPNRPPLTAPKPGNMEAGKNSPLGIGKNSGVAPGMRAGIRANGANESRLRDRNRPAFGRQSSSLVSPLGLGT